MPKVCSVGNHADSVHPYMIGRLKLTPATQTCKASAPRSCGNTLLFTWHGGVYSSYCDVVSLIAGDFQGTWLGYPLFEVRYHRINVHLHS